MADTAVRIAMWSGPRNISTAMMRAWENRAGAAVCDEPLYAHYLLATGLDHPGRDEVIASQATDWRTVVAALTGPIPGGKAIAYQKHMAHHLLPGIDRGWLDRVVNCFLIRRPEEVLASYVRTRDDPTLADLGFAQQGEIFERVCERTGRVPPILDARDVLEHPKRMLTLLCEAVGVPFTDRMLSWPAGRRDSDGVWAEHWYAGVERSTGFAPYRPPGVPLADRLLPLQLYLAQSYAMSGQAEQAKAHVAEVLRLNPDFTIDAYAAYNGVSEVPRNVEIDVSAMRRAGFPE